MTAHTEPPAAGELVVQNGKQRDTRCPLGDPVTVIGSNERCDIRLIGPGIAHVHCLIALTPAGPAIRSWAPDETLVNGEPTTAILLKDGDEIVVGPCVFRLEWKGDDLVPLSSGSDGSNSTSRRSAVPDAAWDLAEREQTLNEQEAQLAAMLEYRRRQLASWYEELVAAREEVRQMRLVGTAAAKGERDRIRQLRSEASCLQQQARADRLKARTLYARFLARMKAKWSAERRQIAAQKCELADAQRRFRAEVARHRSDSTRFQADAESRERRLNEAWALLTDGQRRLLADRQAAERTLALRDSALTQWASELATREETLEAGQQRVEARVQDLLQEVTRLEMRAAHCRSVVQNLEERRVLLEASGAMPSTSPDQVPLHIDPTRSVEELLTDLATRDRELARDRKDLAAAWQELERRAAELFDQRSVIAEQVAAVAVARQMWQTAECTAIAELEELARRLALREESIELRARELNQAEFVRRDREHELWELRARLEAWQASLAAHEGQIALRQERTEAELATRAEQLDRWESSLSTLCRKWSTVRGREIERLRDELAYWARTRDQHQAALSELDRQRARFLTDAAWTARQALAVEELRAERAKGPRKPLAERRLRVLQRKWDRHFARFRAELDARREALAAELSTADERYAKLQDLAVQVADRTAAWTAAEQSADAARLARGRELDERATILSLAEARAERTAQDLSRAREAAEAIAAAVIGTDPPRLPAPAPRPVLLALAPAA